MFWHLYKYRLKASLNSREEVFWSFIFPLILGTCFFVAFSNISNKEYIFHSIPVAIVYEAENETFRETIETIAEDASEGEPFLTISEVTTKEAAALLKDGIVDAVITVNDDISLSVIKSNINQTAVQSFVNQYLQTKSLIEDVIQTNPSALPGLIDSLTDTTAFVKEASFSTDTIDTFVCYYFSLMGMAILFGGFLGAPCAVQMRADQSGVGMRKCLAPVPRNILIFAEYLAIFTIHFASLLVLLAYLTLVLKISFGGQLGYVILTCAIGSIFGISLGIFFGSIPKLSEGLRVSLFLLASLGSSFLSGLMVADLKHLLQTYAPIVNRLNPATLIQDSLYSLLIYNTHDRYFTNMITLSIFTLIICLTSYFMTRRESYANL